MFANHRKVNRQSNVAGINIKWMFENIQNVLSEENRTELFLNVN